MRRPSVAGVVRDATSAGHSRDQCVMTYFRIHRVRLFAVPIIAAAACAGLLHAQEALTFYFIDVEGGQATLIVTPSHQSLLVDAGYGGFDDRDPNRIVAAARDARIDHI